MSNKSRQEAMQTYITDVIAWLEKYNYSPPSAPSWGSNNSDDEINQNIVKNCHWFIGSGSFKEYADANIPDSQNPATSPAMTIGAKTVMYVYVAGSYVRFIFTDWSGVGKTTPEALTVVEDHAGKISGDTGDYLNANCTYDPTDAPPVPPEEGNGD